MKTSNLALLCAALALAACGPMRFANDATRNVELSWLALHAVDTAQTVTIAKSPGCFYERSPLAQMVYGTKHPSVGRVVTTNTVMAAAHWGMGAMLDRHTEAALADDSGNAGLWYAARVSYYAMSFMGTGSAVVGNVRLGIKPLSHQECTK